ncbi:unnamed protein product [Effrenium voratum]|uniref:Uncharacterized protein n=1 Tax=Effrenium voratum TaxID=2562239 RepID=A0AA36NJ89_9DINO|nr:unnamed protein product [Effrenium voratum]CAJ1445137.1 unnamed protein product [Effrenium voratum]
MALLLPAPIDDPRAALCNAAETPKAEPAICELFDDQLAVVKTVRNTDWLELVGKLRTECFRTSVTLPPKGAVGMRLFGETRTSCAGLVWDRSQVDLSAAYIWPSGYMAKTEFNMNHKGELVNGRSSALVTIERLKECNAKRLTTNADTGELQEVPEGAPMSFNEINWPCRGAKGIVGVFVRSPEVQHVLHGLGVIALLEHALGLQLPLVLLDSENPVCLFDTSLLEAYLRQVPSRPAATWPMVLAPRLPLSVVDMDFTEREKLHMHAMFGLTRSSLRQLFMKHADDPARFHELLAEGLRECVHRRNVPSAREIVRTTSPLMVAFSPDEGKYDQNLLNEVLALCEGLTENDEDLMVVLGAEVMLTEFRSGQTQSRIDTAVQQLGEWLRKVNSQCTVCDVLSWVETWKQERQSRMSSFISGKAVANRSDFLRHLKKLRDATDGESYIRELYEVVHALRSPCLRFRMLRQVVGLDERFSRNVLHAIVCLVYDIFVPRAVSAFEVDEAIGLEAAEDSGSLLRRPSREILGVETPENFSSDPLGVETRLFRAQYRQNRSRKFS